MKPRKVIAILLTVFLMVLWCAGVGWAGEEESPIGKWPDGDFWDGIVLYASLEDAEAAGAIDKDRKVKLSIDNRFVVLEDLVERLGHQYVMSYQWLSDGKAEITLRGDEVSEKRVEEQFWGVVSSISATWGNFSGEKWFRDKNEVTEFDYKKELGKEKDFQYNKYWEKDGYIVIAGIRNMESGNAFVVIALSGKPQTKEIGEAHETQGTVSAISEVAFRQTKWGMTPDEVKASEDPGMEFLTDEYIVFVNDVAVAKTMQATMFFAFDGLTGLYQGGYMFTHQHTNLTDFVDDFEDLQTQLTEKYGKPTDEKEIWKGDLYKGDTQRYGMAVATGDLQYLTTYRSGDTEITLFLNGDNYKVSLSLMYKDATYAPSAPEVDDSGL